MEMVDRLIAGEHPVKVWRGHRGLGQRELARLAGLRSGYLSEIENRRKRGGVETLRKLATVLNVAVDDLL